MYIAPGAEDFVRFLPYMGMAAILSWSCDQDRLNKLSFPHPKEAPEHCLSFLLSIWNLGLFGLVILKEKMFENVDIHKYTPTT